jgi:diguanylate cyclase (GGDEF)-like protein/putative nucleotidyltransferase with HDIG domain
MDAFSPEDVTAMGTFLFSFPLNLALGALAAILLLILVLERSLHRRAEQRRKSTELSWFSNLHLLSKALSESTDPKQMAEQALQRTLEMLGTTEGYVLLRAPGPEGMDDSRARGISASTVERLAAASLRGYLASSAERWGSLMVFPDLRRSDLVVAWQRDPLFNELRLVLSAEGLRTLVVVGLQVRGKSYGVLLVGSHQVRAFHPQELRLALAIGNQVSVTLENWSLHRAEERHNEELRILHRVSEALRATFDLKTQVEILRRELTGLLGLTDFSLALQDSPGGTLETVVALESSMSGVSGNAVQPSGLEEYVVRTRVPLLVTHDLLATVRRLGVASLDPRTGTWCGVPIHFSDGSMGVLAVSDLEREHALSERQFEMLQVLADEAAGAIENARLFQQEQRRASHLMLLNELGRKATAVLDPQELLPSICRQVRSAFGYDLARIEIVDRERGELVVEAEAGYGPELLGRRIRFGEGLSGIAADTAEPVLANAVVQEPRYVALHPGVRSALSLPLKYRDQMLGVLSLESRRGHAFSHQDVLTLRTLADQLAIALHNARAYQVALEQAITDGLTGLKTHRYFMEALDGEWRRSARLGHHFSVIMMDLDGFKQVNDRHGHLQGDKVLTAVAELLGARSRQSNVVARYGGDEFAVLMPEATTEPAEILAERLRASLAADPFLAAHGVTASFGIATFPVHGPTQEEILRVADSGMYLAKHENGNRVRVASLVPQSGESERERQLLEAYLGVAVKRMFSTGPEAFNQYLQRFEQVMQGGNGESPSLLDTVTALAFAIDAKDHYTQGHSQAVSRLAAQIARQMGLPDTEVEEVRLAGILHDIGKIGVPEMVLNKPARLTVEEYEVMKSHAALGGKILEPLRVRAIEHIRRMVRHHHESFDGLGYPEGLRGNAIPLGARILTVADCFDTMVSERAYKKGRSLEDAVAELRRCCGSQFDPALVDAFVRSLEAVDDPRKRAVMEETAN